MQVAYIATVALGCYSLSQIDQAERYGKEHNIELKPLDSTKWVTGYVVFVGCVALICLVPMMIVYIFYITEVWKKSEAISTYSKLRKPVLNPPVYYGTYLLFSYMPTYIAL